MVICGDGGKLSELSRTGGLAPPSSAFPSDTTVEAVESAVDKGSAIVVSVDPSEARTMDVRYQILSWRHRF